MTERVVVMAAAVIVVRVRKVGGKNVIEMETRWFMCQRWMALTDAPSWEAYCRA